MDKDYLLLKRAALGRPSGKWNDDDYDVLADGVVVGRIFKVRRLAGRTPWMWTLAFGHDLCLLWRSMDLSLILVARER